MLDTVFPYPYPLVIKIYPNHRLMWNISAGNTEEQNPENGLQSPFFRIPNES